MLEAIFGVYVGVRTFVMAMGNLTEQKVYKQVATALDFGFIGGMLGYIVLLFLLQAIRG